MHARTAPSAGGHLALSRIKGFDGLRALSVLLVFADHRMFPHHELGGLGVKIFFALSGFLIIGILARQRQRLESGASGFWDELRSFWLRRVARIFPVYYLVLGLISVVLLAAGAGLGESGMVWYGLMASDYYIAYVTESWSKFSHLWSLSVEQHFYMLASPLLLGIARTRHGAVLCGLLAASMFFVLYEVATSKPALQVYILSPPNFAFMAVGGLLALGAPRVGPMLSRAVVVLLGCIATIAATVLHEKGMLAPSVQTLGLYLSELLLCASLVGYVSAHQGGVFVRLLELAPLQRLGMISYGFYVYHYFTPELAWLMDGLHLGTPSSLQIKLWMPVQLAMTVAVSWVSWRWLEQPILARASTRQHAEAATVSLPAVR